MSRGKWRKKEVFPSDVACDEQDDETVAVVDGASDDGGGRVRAWTFVLYPESAPPQWRDQLDEYHIAWAESPLHDKDTNADGTVKKPHIHVLLAFPQVKSYEQVLAITSALSCPIPQRIHSMQGMVRYMAHLDNPEKYQYSTADIKGHQGFDVADMLRPSSSLRYELIRDMMRYCIEHKIFDFDILFQVAAKDHFDDWFPLLCDNSAYIMQSFLNARFRRLSTIKQGYNVSDLVDFDSEDNEK